MSEDMQALFKAAQTVQLSCNCIMARVQGGSRPAARPEHMGSYIALDNASPSCWLSSAPKLTDSLLQTSFGRKP